MKRVLIIVKILIIFVILLTTFCNCSNADMGPKPSITINLKNMKTDNYLIDLLVYDESGLKYKSPLNYNGKEGEQYRAPDGEDTGYNSLKTITISQLEILHEINYDGWISESTRWEEYLLFADCSGNSEHKHNFGYFGTPDTYKVVIIDNDTGIIKITDIIHRDDFASKITIDVNEMKFQQSSSVKLIIKNIIEAELIIEVMIALIMNFKHLKVIIFVNLCTNFMLQILLIVSPNSYYISFGILELLVIIIEYLIYKKYIKEESNKKILAYTIIANLMSGIVIPLIIANAGSFVFIIKAMIPRRVIG